MPFLVSAVIFENPQPGGPGPCIYIPQEQGGPVIPPGTVFPFVASYSGGIVTRLHTPTVASALSTLETPASNNSFCVGLDAVGRSRVRFPMRSSNVFNLPNHSGRFYSPGVVSASNRKEYQKVFLGSKALSERYVQFCMGVKLGL
jgi:hypothetical protein